MERCFSGHASLVKILLEAGTDINTGTMRNKLAKKPASQLASDADFAVYLFGITLAHNDVLDAKLISDTNKFLLYRLINFSRSFYIIN